MSATAGYSGTPLPTKLGLRAGSRVALLGAPEHIGALLEPLPDGVVLRRQARGCLDVIVLFTVRRATLERRLPALAQAILPDGALWVAWPKRASRVPTDMTEDVVRDVVLPAGLVDTKVCAIDSMWSGLKVVHRRRNRQRLAPGRRDRQPSSRSDRPSKAASSLYSPALSSPPKSPSIPRCHRRHSRARRARR